jgi:hypothetical protein
MTGLLEKALERVQALPEQEQNAIAAQILESLDDEETWARKLRERPELLRSLAREALDEHRRGAESGAPSLQRKKVDGGDLIQPTHPIARPTASRF